MRQIRPNFDIQPREALDKIEAGRNVDSQRRVPGPGQQQLKPSIAVADNRWLWDYYQVCLWLTDLHFATATAPESQTADSTAAQQHIERFAQERNMPFFRTVASRIISD